jgi:hypothetical protein
MNRALAHGERRFLHRQRGTGGPDIKVDYFQRPGLVK